MSASVERMRVSYADIYYSFSLVFLISGDFQSYSGSVEVYNPYSGRTCILGFDPLEIGTMKHTQCGDSIRQEQVRPPLLW